MKQIRNTAVMVSIHALARRATAAERRIIMGFGGFNPRPRAEGDGDSAPYATPFPMFQSTPSRGGRLSM